MRRPHDHTLAVLDLKGQALTVAKTLLVHLPRARNRLHSDRGQCIADPSGVEAAGVLTILKSCGTLLLTLRLTGWAI